MDVDETDRIVVEFYGPFRAFGKEIELTVNGKVTFDELVGILAQRLGEPFRERALMRNTTFIVNDRRIERKKRGEVHIHSGDRVAFALLIGGG